MTSRRGIVLVTAMFLALLVFSLVAGTVAHTRQSGAFTMAEARRAQARALARSGIHLALGQLSTLDPSALPEGRILSGGPRGENILVDARYTADRSALILNGQAEVEGVRAEVQASVSLTREEIETRLYAARGWVRFSGQPAVYGLDPTSGRWKVLPPLPNQVVGPGARYALSGMGVDLEGSPFVVMRESAGSGAIALLTFRPDADSAQPDTMAGTWSMEFFRSTPPGSLTVSGTDVLITDSGQVHRLRVGVDSDFAPVLSAPSGVSFSTAYTDRAGRFFTASNVTVAPARDARDGLPPSRGGLSIPEIQTCDPTSGSWSTLFSLAPAIPDAAPASRSSPSPGPSPASSSDTMPQLKQVLSDGTVIAVQNGQLQRLSGGAWSPVAGLPPGTISNLTRDSKGGFYVQVTTGNFQGQSQTLHHDGVRFEPSAIAEPPYQVYDLASNSRLVTVSQMAPRFSLMSAGGKSQQASKLSLLWEF